MTVVIHRQWYNTNPNNGPWTLTYPQADEVTVVGIPLPNEKGEYDPYANLQTQQEGYETRTLYALHDLGLVSLNGWWHQFSWVEDPSKRPTSQPQR